MADLPGYVVDAPAAESVTADSHASAEIQAFPRRLVLVTRRRFPVLPVSRPRVVTSVL